MGKYVLAQNLEEALNALEIYKSKARVITGGTDLMRLIKSGKVSVDCIVDITNITGLSYIHYDNGMIRLGALVTHNDADNSPIIREKAVLLTEAARAVGSPQVRNMGTLVGNIANAARAADTPVALVALGAEAKILSKNEHRTIKVEDLFMGSGKINLKNDELIAELSFPELTAEQGGSFIKLAKRRALAIATINVAAVVLIDKERNLFKDARIAIGCVVPKPHRIKRAEEALTGYPVNDENIKKASELVAGEVSPRDGIHGSTEYKYEMTKVLVARAIKNAIERVTRRVS